ncbi:MAG: DNA-3-methyladenine glycosylase I [Cereibacter sphaeroides]|uniref:DNA-3-methyladenine glycosylase I n=1 Tax=Cereibacter sphaeroides TaxID=1063 RepID=A0A2W5S7S9_CERSP|nr:MAG: DNA-3-methyladenine glycosylase I [Cereibacter sphaeroides]
MTDQDTTTGRCPWCGTEPLYIAYHDDEWGVPERDSRALWEKLVLDGFQAGLAWITILRKRDSFRAAFAGFDPNVVATWGEPEVQRLLADTGIVRHRGKIEAAIRSAHIWQTIEQREGFANFIWRYVDGKAVQNRFDRHGQIPAETDLSRRISRDLKAEGMTFVGPTIVYAFLQATGLVNDHLVTCHCHDRVASMA